MKLYYTYFNRRSYTFIFCMYFFGGSSKLWDILWKLRDLIVLNLSSLRKSIRTTNLRWHMLGGPIEHVKTPEVIQPQSEGSENCIAVPRGVCFVFHFFYFDSTPPVYCCRFSFLRFWLVDVDCALPNCCYLIL